MPPAFIDTALATGRPDTLAALRTLLSQTPAEGRAWHPSPEDWRDEVLYFLLPDRFSDNREIDAPAADARGDPAPASDVDEPSRHPVEPVGRFRQALAGRHHQRHSRPPRLPAGARRQRDLGRADLHAAGARRQLSRLRHPGFPRRRSALRHARRSRRAGPRGAHARDAHHPRHHRQSHRRQLGLRRAGRAGRLRVQRAALPAFSRLLRQSAQPGDFRLASRVARRTSAGRDVRRRVAVARPARRGVSARLPRSGVVHARRHAAVSATATSRMRTPSTSAPTSSR